MPLRTDQRNPHPRGPLDTQNRFAGKPMNRRSKSIVLVLVSSPLVLSGCGRHYDEDDRNGPTGTRYGGGGGYGVVGRSGGTSAPKASPRSGFGGFGRFGGFGG